MHIGGEDSVAFEIGHSCTFSTSPWPWPWIGLWHAIMYHSSTSIKQFY